MADIIMTFKEMKAYLKIKHATLYNLARQGKIPASKVGRLWRFRKDRIDRWLRELETAYKKNKAKKTK